MKTVFYGWYVLAGLFLVYMASNGIVLNTLPLFFPDLMQDFAWDEAQVTQPVGIFYLASAFASPVGGILLDRYSPKILMVIGLTTITAALAAIPFMSELWHFIAIYCVFAAGLAIGGLIPSMVLLTRWFDRYRGIAVGFLLMATNLGGWLFPLLISDALVNDGWRAAMFILIFLGGVMMLVPTLLLVRDRPQDMGLQPGGGPQESDAGPVQVATSSATDLTLKQALQSPIFYLLAFVTAVMWFCIVGLLQHQSIFIGQDLAIDTASLAFIFSTFFGCALLGNLVFGYLSDHFDKGLIMLAAMVSLTLGLILLRSAEAGGVSLLYIFALVAGLGYSGSFTMIQLTIAEFFSGASYGKILGTFVFVDTLAGSMGAIVLGSMRVAQGSYVPAFNMMIGLCLAALVSVLYLNRQKQKMMS